MRVSTLILLLWSTCWRHWYDCIASYAHTGTLFMILLMFLQCTDHAVTSATSCILCLLVATFLQLILHIGWGHRFTTWMITCHISLILPTLWHPLLALENCALSVLLHLFVTFARFYNFDHSIYQKLVPDILNIGSITSLIDINIVMCSCCGMLLSASSPQKSEEHQPRHIKYGNWVIQPYIQFALVHWLYCWRIAKPGVTCLIFLSTNCFCGQNLQSWGLRIYFTSFYLYFHSITIAVK